MSKPAHPTSVEIEPIATSARSPHKPHDVDTALLALALAGGDVRHAHRALKAHGLTIPERTLRDWRSQTYPNRYRDLCDRHKLAIEGEVINNVRALALRASAIAQHALDLEADRIASGEIKDAAASLRNIATTIGISVDKVMLLEGRPTHITEQRSSDDVLRGLQAKGYIDATAVEEEPPAVTAVTAVTQP